MGQGIRATLTLDEKIKVHFWQMSNEDLIFKKKHVIEI